MFSYTLNPPPPPTTHFLHTPFLSPPLTTLTPHHKPTKLHRTTTSAIIIPSSSNPPPKPNPQQQQQLQKLYQPFRPPPSQSPIPPKYRNLDTPARLDVLTNRLGVWYEYAPLIPPLIQDGFDPSTLEEITGISGAEQNILVVGAQVRESLVQSDVDPEILEFFDKGGAELLYEIRLLTNNQRADVAKYMLENKFEPSDAQELARAIKDYPRRRGDRGWERFDYTLPADCLAFMYYRQALEYRESELRLSALEKALSVAVSDRAKEWITKELEGKINEGEGQGRGGGVIDGVKVPVVRLNLGEIAEATAVAVFPVCSSEDKSKGVEEAPWEYRGKGGFGIVEADKGWKRWVVLPAWAPVMGVKEGGVAVAFSDGRALPWRVNRRYKEESILVVADRGRNEVTEDDGFFLISSEDELKLERGATLKEKGCTECLGSVVIVVRPPRESNDDISPEEWD
ncbi:putative rubisco accumulation factor 1 [Helianthus annuus]|nr:putative rubisco accumulation factor 1 [Helianthus annuus]KAJ0906087.1 putative rubisco accumulation factor 1 [Helianthus annuus]